MTDVELDILTDLEHTIEDEIRGGVAMISHQYARANAPGMENYNASKCNNYILYLGATAYMDGQSHNFYPRLISNGSQTRKWKN